MARRVGPVKVRRYSLEFKLKAVMLSAVLAGLTQVQEHARGTIDPLTRDERRPDQTQEPGILLGAIREGVLEPS